MEQIDAVAALAALAQDNRLDVYRLLVQAGPDGMAAGAIADRLGLAPNTLTFHFDRLRAAGLVTVRRDGRSMIYAAHFDTMNSLIGYLTGIVVSTGPLSVPLFLFYGLDKGAFLATEAASSLGLYLSKSVTFEQFGALTPAIALQGLIAGGSLMAGAFIAKPFVLRLKADLFRLVMDGIMIAGGLSMLWNAAHSS